jgi:hypothetical protein
MQREDRLYLAGKITKEELIARRNARGAGAAVAVAIVGSYYLGPRFGIAILSWMARNPDKVEQIAGAMQEAGGGPPAVSSSLNVTAAAKSFGFKTGFSAAGDMVAGQMRNGASVLASFSKTGEELGVKVSMVGGGVKGTLQAIEQGALNAGKEAGASLVRLTANLPSTGMARLLRREGFTQVVKDGKSTGNWEKILKVQ